MSYQRGSANASLKDEGGTYVPDDRKALMWLYAVTVPDEHRMYASKEAEGEQSKKSKLREYLPDFF